MVVTTLARAPLRTGTAETRDARLSSSWTPVTPCPAHPEAQMTTIRRRAAITL